MLVELSTHQSPALLSLANSKLGSKLNGHSVKFVNGDRHATQQILHQAPSNSLKALMLSGREITFANSTAALAPLGKKPDPLNRMLTSDNKENPGDLAAHLIPTISGEALEETRVAINAVRRSIDEYGGEVVFKFSQAKGAFYKQIAMHSATQPGACKALCDHWMACHAHALSLFDGLYVGGQKGQFNIDILVSIKQLQIDQTIINSLNSQITIANEWLASYGLKSNSNYPDFKEVGGDAVDVLLGCTADKGCYKLIFLQWDHGKQGHVVSTYTAEGGEVRFFDPNYGDFKFPTLLTFREWLTLELWPRAYEDESMSIGTLSYTVASTKH